MARLKVYSSLKDTKYDVLRKLAKRYDVSDSEIIRAVMERVLGNRKFEKLLIHDVYKDLVSSDDALEQEDNVNNEIHDEQLPNIPDVCPECGEKEDATGKSVIAYNKYTQQWSCSNCFATGGV